MSIDGIYKVRPSGRHILTIGRDLIRDPYAAVVELVKNAYDADSPDVNIEFRKRTDDTGYSIVIADHGHGMSRDTVIHKWMVPSTSDKLDRKQSPSGRTMQGRKGIGRYAASILGNDLLLETVDNTGEKTVVLLVWKAFEASEYIDDVEVLIETQQTSEPIGTNLTIRGDQTFAEEWTPQQFRKLQFELRKLMSPVESSIKGKNARDEFRIRLTINGVSKSGDIDGEIMEPFPLLELFDYRITGRIEKDGRGTLKYSLQKISNAPEEKFSFDNHGPTNCGKLIFDIRAYDREREAIVSLIERGLKDKSGNLLKQSEARELLNEYNGIGVYRNGFRIRPLGDPEFDWLQLNKRRVQNPSLRIGSDQAIGYVLIQSDELSGLAEKSARDGIRENAAFDNLKRITASIIAELEQRRFAYRQKSKSRKTAEQNLARLFSFDTLKHNVRLQLNKKEIDEQTINVIVDIINQDEKSRNRVAKEIYQSIAVYQGQATLGKIINVILHEGRGPLQYLRNQIKNLHYYREEFSKTESPEHAQKIIDLTAGIADQLNVFVNLFSRLDPLSARKRSSQKKIALKQAVQNALKIFEEEIKSQSVKAKIAGGDGLEFLCWPQDMQMIFTNLIDNSLYWMSEKNATRREITIEIVLDDDALHHIDYRDTGPGISPSLIASAIIFEPSFSTKQYGTGLGLAISGEAANRNNLELIALESNHGAHFRLQQKTELEDG